jgi:carbonic anhydrase/acetyltransferase-like protein (isoleucine patch superfamily)
MAALEATARAGVYSFEGMTPKIADDVFIAPGAMIVGDVEIGSGSSVWFNVVIRADCAPVRIGARTNIQDCAVVHVDPDAPCTIGDDVTVGHSAIVHGTTVGDRVMIAMGAIVLSRSVVESESLIAAGAVVPEAALVRAGTLVAGIPGKEKRELADDNRARLRLGADHYAEYSRRFRASLKPVMEEQAKHGD